MSQVRETAAVRHKQFEQKQLRSRQRDNYQHLLKRFGECGGNKSRKNTIPSPLPPRLHFSQSAKLPECRHSAGSASGGGCLPHTSGPPYFKENHQVCPASEIGLPKLSKSVILPLQVSQESAALCRELFLPDFSLQEPLGGGRPSLPLSGRTGETVTTAEEPIPKVIATL